MYQSCLLLTALLAVAISGNTQVAPGNAFSLAGDLSDIKTPVSWVYLSYSSNGARTIDSVQPKNGKYLFGGKVSEAVQGRLRVSYTPVAGGVPMAPNSKRDQAIVFLQPGKIKVTSTDSFSNVKVNGSKAHDEFEALNESLKSENQKMESLLNQYAIHSKNKDEEAVKKLLAEYEALSDRIGIKHKEFASKNPGSPIALYALSQYAGFDFNPSDVEPLFLALPAGVRTSTTGKQFREKIEIAKKTAVGTKAMEFVQNDTLGNPIALSSFRGKYVLVDFWASWCGPCRQENPNVVEAFNKFRDKGFHVLGVSLDQPNAKDKWIKAIHDDQLFWTQVSDLQFWKNAVAVQYGIQSIPQNLLIDPQGVIIARNLRGEKLQQKLEEIFKATSNKTAAGL